MPSIQRNSVDDIIGTLPDWERLTVMPSASLFIGAVGFEDRSPTCFERWCRTVAGTDALAILIHYPAEQGSSPEQEGRFDRAVMDSGVARIDVTYDRLRLYGEVARLLLEQSHRTAVVDISTMASYVFYPLFAALLEFSGLDLTVCYTEAMLYFPSRSDWVTFRDQVQGLDLLERARLFDETHFQSSGVEQVFEAPNFSAINPDNLPLSLAMIPNFSFERVNRMLEYVADRHNGERGRVTWLIGMPPNQTINGWRHDALWEMFGKPSNFNPVSTFQYKEILVTLHRHWDERYLREAIMVADLGSKAQHIGVLLFHTMHPEVGIVISEPREFTVARYSHESGDQWKLAFGSVDTLQKNLGSWNRLTFKWDDDLAGAI